MWHGARRENAESRATALREAANYGRKEDVGGEWPAMQRGGVAGGESGERLRVGHATRASSRATSRRNSARRIFASHRRWRRTQRIRGARAAGRAARRCQRRIGRTVFRHVQALRAYSDAAARCNNTGRIFASRRARARSASNAMGHGARRDHSVAQQRTQRSPGARAAGWAAKRCRRRAGRMPCELGTQGGHLRTPRRNATARAASVQAATAGYAAEQVGGENGRPGNEALPAENRQNSLEAWQATRASSDAAARRNSAAAYLQATGPERDARATRCDLARGEITTTTSRPRTRRISGRDRPAGQRGVASGESREQFAN